MIPVSSFCRAGLLRSFFSLWVILPFLCRQAQAQCTPVSAQICVSGDDVSQVYVGGSSLGTFPYAGAPGTAMAANPTCMSVPTALLTGAQVCLAVYTQNTAPQDVYTAWDLDITCSNGQHSEITSAGSGIQVDYVAAGNPSAPPANDGSGNPWYATNYTGSAFSSSYCSSGVTGSLWAAQLYDPTTGSRLPFISNNCSGDYGTSNGALFWRQALSIPAPSAPKGPPNLSITQTGYSAVTNVTGNTVGLSYNIIVCNTGGPVTNGPVTVADTFLTNASTGGCNNFQFGCWGYGDALVPYTLCYYSAANGLANEPTATSNDLVFPSLPSGCVTMTAAVTNYYDPVPSCGLTLIDLASVTWPAGSGASNPLTYIQLLATPTQTPVLSYTFTPSPTATPTITPSPTQPPLTFTPTATTPSYLSTVGYCPADPPTVFNTIATEYAGTSSGNCGFPAGNYDANMYVAINTADYANGMACGACIAATDTALSNVVTVMVADSCPSCATAHQLDLPPNAWNALTNNAAPGIANITWNFVPCPLGLMGTSSTGHIAYQWKAGCSAYYDPIQFMDMLFPITSAAFSVSLGGPYTSLAPGAGSVGNFEYWMAPGGNLNSTTGPFYFAVTDGPGQSVTLGPITVAGCGTVNDTGLQFTGCGTSTPTPFNTYTYALSLTPTPSLTGTITATPSITPTVTATGSMTPTASLTASRTATDTPVFSYTSTPTQPPLSFTPTAVAPNVSLVLVASFAVTNTASNTVTLQGNYLLCNSGGPVVSGPSTFTLNTLVNASTCNTFVFGCFGYGDSAQPYAACYYASGINEPTASANHLVFPVVPNGCATITTLEVDYYDPAAACGLTWVGQASAAGPFGSLASTPVTYRQTAGATPTPSPTPTVSLMGPVPIYPNPATGNQVTLDPKVTSASPVTIVFYSMSFGKVKEVVFPDVQPGQTVTMDLVSNAGKTLANGLYFVRVITNSGQKLTKLLVLR